MMAARCLLIADCRWCSIIWVSSAWAKRYFQETGSEAVDALFEQLPIMACSPLGLSRSAPPWRVSGTPER